MSIRATLQSVNKILVDAINESAEESRRELQGRLGTIYILDLTEIKYTLDLFLRGKGAAKTIKKTSGYGIFGQVLKNYDALIANQKEGFKTLVPTQGETIDTLNIDIFDTNFSYKKQLDALWGKAKLLAAKQENTDLNRLKDRVTKAGLEITRGDDLVTLKKTLTDNTLYNIGETQNRIPYVFLNHEACQIFHNSLENEVRTLFFNPIVADLNIKFKLSGDKKASLQNAISEKNVNRAFDVAHGSSIGLPAQLFNIVRNIGRAGLKLQLEAESKTGAEKLLYKGAAGVLRGIALDSIRKYIAAGFETIPINIREITDTRLETFLKHDVDLATGEIKSEMTVIVSTQGAKFNSSQATIERLISQTIKDKILKLYTVITGSPNLAQVIETAVFKQLTKKLNKLNNVRIKGPKNKLTKVSTSDSTSSSNSYDIRSGKKSKTKRGAPIAAKSTKIRSMPSTDFTAGPLQVLGYINQRLAQVVEKNMIPPGLESRTGRFARSVRALNMVSTRKGFPSIEYTYERDPYQVFEMGIGRIPWATPDRDPRKLIDRSIREIAGEMLKGRLFTRRV